MGNQDKIIKCPQCNSRIAEESRYCYKCGSFLEEKADTLTYTPPLEKIIDDRLHFTPGDHFGSRYRIVEEIGRGGMGHVYKAEDLELDLTVALKMIRPEHSSNPRFIQRFKEETRLARSISHENVIRIHDLGDVDDIKFISMDYIKGHDLKELIHTSGTLSVDTAISITRQICEGLVAAHQKNIVHLDLKPRNIMIDYDGRVYVMDFGVARSMEARESDPSKKISGTPPYISPEQAKGEEVDQRSDIYSLGIIIFEMLMGKRPFEADTLEDYIEKHIHKKPPSPSETNPLIPPFLEAIILRCLEKEKEKRYQCTDEILRDLKEHIEESGVYIPKAKVKKIWKFSYLVPVVLLMALAIYLFVGRKKPEISSTVEGGRIPLVVMPFENNTGDENLNYWRIALSDLLSADLAQSKHLYVLPSDRLLQILKKMKQEAAERYSTDILDEIASQESIKYFILASYAKAGDNFRISLKIRESWTEEHTGTEIVQGKGMDSLFDLVDELTLKIKPKLNISNYDIAADYDKDVGEIFTYSTDAMRLYTLGFQYFQDGKFWESIDVLMKAVEIDKEFVRAYRQISINYDYLGDVDQAKKYAQIALSLSEKSERVSLRDRYLVQGWAYFMLEDSDRKVVENYEEMLEYYPDDADAISNLGNSYRLMEEWDLAFEMFTKSFKMEPSTGARNIVNFYMAKGLYKKAKEFLLANQRNYPNQVDYHSDLGLIYLCQQLYNLALIEIERAIILNPDNYINTEMKGHMYHLQENFQKAEYYFQQLMKKDDLISQYYGRSWLVRLYLAKGQYKKCRNEIIKGIMESEKKSLKPCKLDFLLSLTYLKIQMKQYKEAMQAADQAQKIAAEILYRRPRIIALQYKGLIQLKMNKINEVKKTAELLKQMIEKTGVPKYERYYYCLMGMIAKKENMTSQSIEDFKNSLSFLSYQHQAIDEHAFFIYPLALSYYQLGDMDEAQNQFEKILDLTTGRLLWGDIYARSYYWLGKIFQKKGWREQAIEKYGKFLQLMKEADSDIPEIEDAKQQQLQIRKESKN